MAWDTFHCPRLGSQIPDSGSGIHHPRALDLLQHLRILFVLSSGFAPASPHPFCAEIWILSSSSMSFLCLALDLFQQLHILSVLSSGFVPASPCPFCVELQTCSSISTSFLCWSSGFIPHLFWAGALGAGGCPEL